MDLEFFQLDLRYEQLRRRDPIRERRLLGSIAEVGQQAPIIVVRDGDRWVVVDGYKRARVLRRLGHDTVCATEWMLAEADALVLERVLRAGDAGSAIEQGWLLKELSGRFGLGRDELARRFDRTTSWVSRRIALVTELPASVHQHVHDGALGAHAVMKYLVPLARANAGDCEKLAQALAPLRPSSRQMRELYATYVAGNPKARELVVNHPALVLRARAEAVCESMQSCTQVEHLLADLGIVTAVTRRAIGRLMHGALDDANGEERQRVTAAVGEAQGELETVRRRLSREMGDAG
jgi:ParB family transcriptional regulator, chromosome partitioning protein